MGVQIPPGLPNNVHRVAWTARGRDSMMNKIKEFFRDVKVEIKKVVYPSREELIGSTWVVIITSIVISLFLGIVDLGLTKLVKIALR